MIKKKKEDFKAVSMCFIREQQLFYKIKKKEKKRKSTD